MDRCCADVLRRIVAPGECVEPRVEPMRRFITSKDPLLYRRDRDTILRAGAHHDHLLLDDCIFPLER